MSTAIRTTTSSRSGSFGARCTSGDRRSTRSARSVTSTARRGTVAVGNVSNHLDSLLDVVTCVRRIVGVGLQADVGARLRGRGRRTRSRTQPMWRSATSTPTALPMSSPACGARRGGVGRLLQDGCGRSRRRIVASPVAAKPQPIATADVDADSRDDIVVLHDSVCRVLRLGRPSAGSPQTGAGTCSAPNRRSRSTTFGPTLRREGARGRRSRGRRARRRRWWPRSYGMSILVQNSGRAAVARQGVDRRRATELARDRTSRRVSFRPSRSGATRRTSTERPSSSATPPVHPVAATVGYDGGTHVITVTPTAPLADGSYAVHLSGLADTGGETLDRRGHDVHRRPRARRDRPADHAALAAVGIPFHRERHALVHDERGWFGVLVQRQQRPYHTCTSPQHVTAKAGAHSFRVFARDAAGQRRPVARARDLDVPAAGPRLLDARARAARSIASATRPDSGMRRRRRRSTSTCRQSGYGYWIVDRDRPRVRVRRRGLPRQRARARRRRLRDEHQSDRDRATATGCSPGAGACTASATRTSTATCAAVHLNGGVVDSVAHAVGPRLLHGRVPTAECSPSATPGSTVRPETCKLERAGAVARSRSRRQGLLARRRRTAACSRSRRRSAGRWARRGSTGPIVGMVAFGNGYLMVGADGGIFNFSTKPFYGSLGGHPPAVPIVSVAAVRADRR